MDYYLYNYLGYSTNFFLNENASIIQRVYRDHRSYEINRRLDIIEGKMFDYLERNKDLEQDALDELDFWKDLRTQIKRENKIDI